MGSINAHVTEIIDIVFERLSKFGYDSLNRSQRTLVCVWSTSGEVGNGGFDQYFFNTSGDWAADTVEAFHTLGSATIASIIQDAIDVFPDGKPSPDLEVRRAQLDSLPSVASRKLAELDQKFYGAEKGLDSLIAAFVNEYDLQLRERPVV